MKIYAILATFCILVSGCGDQREAAFSLPDGFRYLEQVTVSDMNTCKVTARTKAAQIANVSSVKETDLNPRFYTALIKLADGREQMQVCHAIDANQVKYALVGK